MVVGHWFLRWLSRLIIIALILVTCGGLYLFYDYKRFLQTPMVLESSPKTFSVKAGDTVTSLLKTFAERDMPLATESPFSQYLGSYYFRYLAKYSGKATRLKVGDYRLTDGMTPVELLDLLISDNTITYKVQFIEGKNFKQLRTALTQNPHIEQTLLYVPDKDIMATLGEIAITHPEGMFFPDTYQFPNRTKDFDILKQSYKLMQKNLAEAWENRDKTTATMLKTPYELLILASIIEKETGTDSERHKISGVFHRRLARNMRLQTDPTVIYGLGERYRGTIYKSDLQEDTPYNTYTRSGLPPTPIAMPSKASLLAAGQPDKGTALYFVANGKGGHTFSATYQEHLKAVEVYRQQQQ